MRGAFDGYVELLLPCQRLRHYAIMPAAAMPLRWLRLSPLRRCCRDASATARFHMPFSRLPCRRYAVARRSAAAMLPLHMLLFSPLMLPVTHYCLHAFLSRLTPPRLRCCLTMLRLR